MQPSSNAPPVAKDVHDWLDDFELDEEDAQRELEPTIHEEEAQAPLSPPRNTWVTLDTLNDRVDHMVMEWRR